MNCCRAGVWYVNILVHSLFSHCIENVKASVILCSLSFWCDQQVAAELSSFRIVLMRTFSAGHKMNRRALKHKSENWFSCLFFSLYLVLNISIISVWPITESNLNRGGFRGSAHIGIPYSTKVLPELFFSLSTVAFSIFKKKSFSKSTFFYHQYQFLDNFLLQYNDANTIPQCSRCCVCCSVENVGQSVQQLWIPALESNGDHCHDGYY